MKNTRRSYYKLTESEIAAYEKGIITDERNSEDILIFLTALRELDHHRRWVSRMLIGFLFATLISGLAIHAAFADTYLQYGAYGLSVLIFCALVFRGGFSGAPQSFDTVIALCRILSNDVGKNTPICLKIDIRSGNDKRNLVSEHASNIERGKCLTSIYTNEWLTLQTQLEDKTKLEIVVQDHIKIKKLSRRNPRGKMKEIWRRKNKTIITVSVKRKAVDQAPLVEWVTKTGALYSEGDKIPNSLNRIVELTMVALQSSVNDKDAGFTEGKSFQ